MIDSRYDLPQDHRPLQVSFAVDIADGRYAHESRLGSTEAELRKTLEIRPDWVAGRGRVDLDGRISVLYRGQELLGPRWWIDLVFGMASLGEIIEGRRSQQRLNNSSGQFVEFERSGAWVAMRLHDRGNTRNRPHLPFGDFVIEWGLAILRVQRVGAELGGLNEQMGVASYHFNHEFGPMSWQSHVPKELLEYTLRAPLGEVLSNPVPQLS